MNHHDIALWVTDKMFGKETYAKMHIDDPRPGVQAAIRKARDRENARASK